MPKLEGVFGSAFPQVPEPKRIQFPDLEEEYSGQISYREVTVSVKYLWDKISVRFETRGGFFFNEGDKHFGVSTQSRCYVDHFLHVPPAVWLILQLLCSPTGNRNFRKKTKQSIVNEGTPQIVEQSFFPISVHENVQC